MKKILKKISFFSLLVGSVVALNTTEAAALPTSAKSDFTVINISQNNQNATQVGVRPGDVLRYELKINSPTENVIEFTPEFQIADILKKAELIDAGLGQLSGTTLIFPPYSQAAPCEKEFSFFVRLKPCDQLSGAAQVGTNNFGANLLVPIQCENTKPVLIDTGSSTTLLGIIGLGAFILVIAIFGSLARRPQ